MIEIGAVLKMAKPRRLFGGGGCAREKKKLLSKWRGSGDIKARHPERGDVEKRFKEGLELQVVTDK